MENPSEEQLQFPSEEQMQRYRVQHQEIHAMKTAAEADESLFPALGLRLDQALSDPTLPHDYRFWYHMMNVIHTTGPS
jgi:hypothetical protein